MAMNQSKDDKLPLLVECACGCGRKFKPKYRWHKYFETRCRVRAWIKKKTEEAELNELKVVKEKIKKIEEHLGMK